MYIIRREKRKKYYFLFDFLFFIHILTFVIYFFIFIFMYILLKPKKEKKENINLSLFQNESNELEENINNENDIINSDYLTFKEKDITQEKLLEYNSFHWFNVYRTLNSFIWNKRNIKDIDKFKRILIDIDGTKNFIEFIDKLASLKTVYWIYPFEVNETYKWFHMIFELDEELAYLDKEQYISLSKILNSFLWWDYKAHQIDWLYKVHWFVDFRDNRNFKIENKSWLLPSKWAKITINALQKLLGLEKKDDIIFRDIKKIEDKKIFKKSMSDFVDKLQWLWFKKLIIPALEKNWIKVNIDSKNFIDWTSWLSWNPKSDYVNDFTHWKHTFENRGNWNYNFLYNYIFKKNYASFFNFCSKFLWLNPPTPGNNIKMIPIAKEIVFWITKKTPIKELDTMSKETKDVFKEYINSSISITNEVWEQIIAKKWKWISNDIINTIIALKWFLDNSNPEKDIDGNYHFELNWFLKYIWKDNLRHRDRINVLEILKRISLLTVDVAWEKEMSSWEKVFWVFSKKIIDLKWIVVRNQKVYLVLDFLSNTPAWNYEIPESILKINDKFFTNENNKLSTAMYVYHQVTNPNSITNINVNEIIDRLWLWLWSEEKKVRYKIKEFFEWMKNLGLIKDFLLWKWDEKNNVKIMWIKYKKTN